jgi:hypothetical protein
MAEDERRSVDRRARAERLDEAIAHVIQRHGEVLRRLGKT